MATKLELQNALIAKTNELAQANRDIAYLRSMLNEADIRARKLIASRNHGNPDRRAAMEAARRAALQSGVTTKASF